MQGGRIEKMVQKHVRLLSVNFMGSAKLSGKSYIFASSSAI